MKNKILKRALMLGALIGCMATAAWAGNVEIDITDTEFGRGAPEVQYVADGYYVTSSQYGSRATSVDVYHFDKNGRVSWKETTESGEVTPVITRYIYDQDGNLIKSVRIGEGKSTGHYTDVDTYTYDNLGRVLTHVWDSKRETLTDYKQTDTFTYGEGSIATETVMESSEGYYVLDRMEYTLNEKNQIVDSKSYRGSDADSLSLRTEMTYAYDENGNLTKIETIDTEEKIVMYTEQFFYDGNGRCIKSESKTTGERYSSAYIYGYDENGNVVSVSYMNYYPDGKETLEIEEAYTYEKLSPVQDDPSYTDVTNKNVYYYDAVNWATQTGVAAGVGNDQFAPDGSCTRGQLVSFLWRAAGRPEPETTESPFTDVQDPNAYYYKAVLWAAENGIAAGVGDNRFAPDDICNRAQIVTFIHRASGDTETYTNNPFQDLSSDKYYYNAVLWAVANGVVAGTSDTTFSPDQNCTRAQGVSFLYRGIGLY